MFYYIQSWIYPILLLFVATGTVFTSYFVSTHNGNALKDFPFISDIGNKGLSSSLFTFLCSISNFLLFVNMTIRYEQIKTRYNPREHNAKRIANNLYVFLGLVACLGINIIFSFQSDTSLTVHDTGVFLAFSMAVLYCFLQTIFSFFLMDLPGSSAFVIFTRIIISVLQIVFLAANVVMILLYFDSKNPDDRRSAAILQWTVFFLVMLYPLTFIREFALFDMRVVEYKKSKKTDRKKTTVKIITIPFRRHKVVAEDKSTNINTITIPGRKDSF